MFVNYKNDYFYLKMKLLVKILHEKIAAITVESKAFVAAIAGTIHIMNDHDIIYEMNVGINKFTFVGMYYRGHSDEYTYVNLHNSVIHENSLALLLMSHRICSLTHL